MFLYAGKIRESDCFINKFREITLDCDAGNICPVRCVGHCRSMFLLTLVNSTRSLTTLSSGVRLGCP